MQQLLYHPGEASEIVLELSLNGDDGSAGETGEALSCRSLGRCCMSAIAVRPGLILCLGRMCWAAETAARLAAA
jgi:hypothetical protein